MPVRFIFRCRLFFLLFSVLLILGSGFTAAHASASASGPLRFQITLSRKLAAVTGSQTSGRLFVLMSDSPDAQSHLSTGFDPSGTWIAATEFTDVAPGSAVTFNPDLIAYPHAFSKAHPGKWQFMALLDRDHSYAYDGEDGDDLFGPVVTARIDPAHAGTIMLALDQQTSDPEPPDTQSIRKVTFVSPLLSAFWGRPITMRAGVLLPPNYDPNAADLYPTVYHVHGYGSSYRDAFMYGPMAERMMASGKAYPFVHVFLDASFSLGHTVFADSVNNGPWGQALTTEFIPDLEQTYHLKPDSSARFLTGHSSGGWSTLWLQTTYPDFFGGTWSTSPDPVDLRSFTGVDVTPGSHDNMYRKADGTPHYLVRIGGKDVYTIEQFTKQEVVAGDYGGQFASFEAVWSPRGPDGRPMPVFDRKTGVLDQQVLIAWQKYDIRKNLEDHWDNLGPKLAGKIHLVCGDEDTYHLDSALRYLDAFFKRVHSDAAVEFVPGRDHMDLYELYKTYPEGLSLRIDQEMAAKYKSSGMAR